jgi:hypothetical protein
VTAIHKNLIARKARKAPRHFTKTVPVFDTGLAVLDTPYHKQIFGNDIRAFVPQIAMSAGTIMALRMQSTRRAIPQSHDCDHRDC